MTGILIAEPDERIAAFIEKGLRASGFVTAVEASSDDVLRLARSGRFALLVLDLDASDGRRVLQEVRRPPALLPVVALAGRYRAGDHRLGPAGVGVDTLPKPFRFDDLLERIEARVGKERTPEPILRVGDVALRLRTRQAVVGGRAIDLSRREFELALTFLRRPGHVLTREELLDAVWGYHFDPRSNVIDVYVGYLRRKLGRERITSVRRVGYRFEPHPPPNERRGGGRTAASLLVLTSWA